MRNELCMLLCLVFFLSLFVLCVFAAAIDFAVCLFVCCVSISG